MNNSSVGLIPTQHTGSVSLSEQESLGDGYKRVVAYGHGHIPIGYFLIRGERVINFVSMKYQYILPSQIMQVYPSLSHVEKGWCWDVFEYGTKSRLVIININDGHHGLRFVYQSVDRIMLVYAIERHTKYRNWKTAIDKAMEEKQRLDSSIGDLLADLDKLKLTNEQAEKLKALLPVKIWEKIERIRGLASIKTVYSVISMELWKMNDVRRRLYLLGKVEKILLAAILAKYVK